MLPIISEYSLDMTSQCRQARPSRTLSMQAPLRNADLTNPSILFCGKTNKQKPTTHQHTTRREKKTPSSSAPPLHLHPKHLGMCSKLVLLLLKLVKPSFSHLKLEPARLLSTHTHTHKVTETIRQCLNSFM